MLEDGHARRRRDPAHELFAAARDDEVDEIVELEEHRHRGAIDGVHELDGVRRPAHLLQGLGQDGGDEAVRLEGFAATAQDHRVARLDAQSGRVGRHVGP